MEQRIAPGKDVLEIQLQSFSWLWCLWDVSPQEFFLKRAIVSLSDVLEYKH